MPRLDERVRRFVDILEGTDFAWVGDEIRAVVEDGRIPEEALDDQVEEYTGILDETSQVVRKRARDELKKRFHEAQTEEHIGPRPPWPRHSPDEQVEIALKALRHHVIEPVEFLVQARRNLSILVSQRNIELRVAEVEGAMPIDVDAAMNAAQELSDSFEQIRSWTFSGAEMDEE